MLSESCYRRLDWDFECLVNPRFEAQWARYTPRNPIRPVWDPAKKLWLEIGAGTGSFFRQLAVEISDTTFLAIERDRHRGKTLETRAQKAGLENFIGLRANAVPWVMHHVPDHTLDRIYILYPCPWPKTSERKNRWYLHPFMDVLLRKLRPGGHIVWSSDQQFYIEEAAYTCDKKHALKEIKKGPLSPHPMNYLEKFPSGRTKFEGDFLAQSLPCFELIVEKP
ncbi:MAG: hypothetical protein H6617_11560 [Bdellovibrionaceae bacterium]|nr:hypothetical protein [Bdellovibrionales bacterium]MCB9255309.1 hypothetical protein [Pseudobdellovibrionaceae bacterium]